MSSEVSDGIGEMLKVLGGSQGVEPEEKPTDIVEEDLTDEISEEDQEEEKGTEEEIEDNEVEIESSTKPEDEPDERDSLIAELRERVDQLSKKDKPKEEPKEEPTKDTIEIEDQDFIQELDLYELTSDKSHLNRVLNDVYKKGMKSTQDNIMSKLPSIIRDNIQLVTTLQAARDAFYSDYPELESYKGTVTTVFEEVAAKNPDKSYKDILEEVGKEAMQKLGITKKAKQEEIKPPRLPKKKGNQRTIINDSEPSGLEGELEEMNKVLGG